MLFIVQPPATPNNRYISGSRSSSPSQQNNGSASTGNSATSTQKSASANFRRSYIVCKTPPAPLPDTVNPSSAHPEVAVYRKALEKAQTRIASLERCIESLQEQHKGSLKDLHNEVSRLQNLCSDVGFAEIVLDIPLDDFDDAEMKTLWTKKTSQTKDATDIADYNGPSKTNPSNNNNSLSSTDIGCNDPVIDETKPYYLLLQQQRRKYQSFIERMNADNKRKQTEIEALRAELELVRDVLAVSGLDVDLVQLRGIVNGKDKCNELAARAKKANVHVLPPIAKPASVSDAGSVIDSGGADGGAYESTEGGHKTGVGRGAAPRTVTDKLKQRPRDYHNGNLDYNGRAHLFSVPPTEDLTESMALSVERLEEATAASTENQRDKMGDTILPPIKTKSSSKSRGLLDLVDPFTKTEKATTSWTKRLKGTQMLRSKQNMSK
ncbi:hypothetical protein HDU78_000656 [Chytriomyces hyalinus]|nr:hypothetical protein HDU78_000656 [Chytriomyces hyalinus]